MEVDNDVKEAIDRIEYYLSTENISKDPVLAAFLSQSIEKFIPIEEFLKFPDISMLVKSIEDLKSALYKREIFEFSSDGNEIKLRDSNDQTRDIDKRTVRIQGYSEDSSESQIAEHLTSIPEVETIQFKKNVYTHLFSGIVYVIFKTEEDAAAFVKNAYEKIGLKAQILDSYLSGGIDKNKNEEVSLNCLYVTENMSPATKEEIHKYMYEIIPSTADFVYVPDKHFCIIRFAEPSDGIACSRKISETLLNGMKVGVKSVASRSKTKMWDLYVTLKNKKDL